MHCVWSATPVLLFVVSLLIICLTSDKGMEDAENWVAGAERNELTNQKNISKELQKIIKLRWDSVIDHTKNLRLNRCSGNG